MGKKRKVPPASVPAASSVCVRKQGRRMPRLLLGVIRNKARGIQSGMGVLRGPWRMARKRLFVWGRQRVGEA